MNNQFQSPHVLQPQMQQVRYENSPMQPLSHTVIMRRVQPTPNAMMNNEQVLVNNNKINPQLLPNLLNAHQTPITNNHSQLQMTRTNPVPGTVLVKNQPQITRANPIPVLVNNQPQIARSNTLPADLKQPVILYKTNEVGNHSPTTNLIQPPANVVQRIFFGGNNQPGNVMVNNQTSGPPPLYNSSQFSNQASSSVVPGQIETNYNPNPYITDDNKSPLHSEGFGINNLPAIHNEGFGVNTNHSTDPEKFLAMTSTGQMVWVKKVNTPTTPNISNESMVVKRTLPGDPPGYVDHSNRTVIFKHASNVQNKSSMSIDGPVSSAPPACVTNNLTSGTISNVVMNKVNSPSNFNPQNIPEPNISIHYSRNINSTSNIQLNPNNLVNGPTNVLHPIQNVNQLGMAITTNQAFPYQQNRPVMYVRSQIAPNLPSNAQQNIQSTSAPHIVSSGQSRLQSSVREPNIQPDIELKPPSNPEYRFLANNNQSRIAYKLIPQNQINTSIRPIVTEDIQSMLPDNITVTNVSRVPSNCNQNIPSYSHSYNNIAHPNSVSGQLSLENIPKTIQIQPIDPIKSTHPQTEGIEEPPPPYFGIHNNSSLTIQRYKPGIADGDTSTSGTVSQLSLSSAMEFSAINSENLARNNLLDSTNNGYTSMTDLIATENCSVDSAAIENSSCLEPDADPLASNISSEKQIFVSESDIGKESPDNDTAEIFLTGDGKIENQIDSSYDGNCSITTEENTYIETIEHGVINTASSTVLTSTVQSSYDFDSATSNYEISSGNSKEIIDDLDELINETNIKESLNGFLSENDDIFEAFPSSSSKFSCKSSSLKDIPSEVIPEIVADCHEPSYEIKCEPVMNDVDSSDNNIIISNQVVNSNDDSPIQLESKKIKRRIFKSKKKSDSDAALSKNKSKDNEPLSMVIKKSPSNSNEFMVESRGSSFDTFEENSFDQNYADSNPNSIIANYDCNSNSSSRMKFNEEDDENFEGLESPAGSLKSIEVDQINAQIDHIFGVDDLANIASQIDEPKRINSTKKLAVGHIRPGPKSKKPPRYHLDQGECFYGPGRSFTELLEQFETDKNLIAVGQEMTAACYVPVRKVMKENLVEILKSNKIHISKFKKNNGTSLIPGGKRPGPKKGYKKKATILQNLPEGKFILAVPVEFVYK